MTIDELKALCDRLKMMRESLAELKLRHAACTLSGHQKSITVEIAGVGKFGLTYCDYTTGYASRVIKGREMILLGVKKALEAMVDERAETVRQLEQQIADARVTP